MKLRYCRHCKEIVPMFGDGEYASLKTTYWQCIRAIKNYRRSHGTTLEETPLRQLYQPFFDLYFQLARTELVFEVDEVIRRHYLSRWNAYRHEAGTEPTIQVTLEFPDEGISQVIAVIELGGNAYQIEDVTEDNDFTSRRNQ